MQDDDEFLTCKVVLLGESGVGKTSIIQRYIKNSFNPGISSTGGANFASKKIYFEEEKKELKFEIWDTAGQEKFRSLARVFYKDASICILVYDITRRESFEELQNFWIDEIRNNISSKVCKSFILILIILFIIVFAVVGNKIDDYENEKIKVAEGKAFAKKINAIFQSTSAKQANGIDELFNKIGKYYLNPDISITSNLTKEEKIKNKQRIKIEKINNKTNDKKKRCC